MTYGLPLTSKMGRPKSCSDEDKFSHAFRVGTCADASDRSASQLGQSLAHPNPASSRPLRAIGAIDLLTSPRTPRVAQRAALLRLDGIRLGETRSVIGIAEAVRRPIAARLRIRHTAQTS